MTPEEVYTQNEKLVYYILNKMMNVRRQHIFCEKNGFELCDLEQHGRLALWKACTKRKGNDNEFKTYAYKTIEGAYKNLIFHMEPIFLIRLPYHNTQDERKEVGDKLSLDKELYGQFDTLKDFLPSKDNVEHYVMKKLELEDRLKYMTDKQREYTLMFLDGYSTTEIADHYGLKQQYGISQGITTGMKTIDPDFKMSFRLSRRTDRVG